MSLIIPVAFSLLAASWVCWLFWDIEEDSQ